MTNLLHTLFTDVQNGMNRTSHQRARSVLIWALVLQVFASTAFGGIGHGKPFPKTKGNFHNPAVAPVHSHVFGTAYEELAAKSWQWQFSMPVSASPVFDTADCSTNQSGKVWFLASSGAPFETSPGVFQSVAP